MLVKPWRHRHPHSACCNQAIQSMRNTYNMSIAAIDKAVLRKTLNTSEAPSAVNCRLLSTHSEHSVHSDLTNHVCFQSWTSACCAWGALVVVGFCCSFLMSFVHWLRFPLSTNPHVQHKSSIIMDRIVTVDPPRTALGGLRFSLCYVGSALHFLQNLQNAETYESIRSTILISIMQFCFQSHAAAPMP